MLAPFVESSFGGPNGLGHGELWIGAGRRDDGETGSQRAAVEPGVEHSGSEALGSDAVAVSFRDALDESVQAQATQVVGDAAGSVLARLVPEQGSETRVCSSEGPCCFALAFGCG